MPHLQIKRITPTDFNPKDVLFPVPLTPLPGRVILCMFPPRLKTDGGILLDGQEAPEGSKYQPDFGVVVKSGYRGIDEGMTVGVKPYDGMWLNHHDYAWIPKGRQVRIYPTSGDTIADSIEIAVEV